MASPTLRRALPIPPWTLPLASSATPSSWRRSLSVKSPTPCLILPFASSIFPLSSSLFMKFPPEQESIQVSVRQPYPGSAVLSFGKSLPGDHSSYAVTTSGCSAVFCPFPARLRRSRGGRDHRLRHQHPHQEGSARAFRVDADAALPHRCVRTSPDRVAQLQSGRGLDGETNDRVGPGERPP